MFESWGRLSHNGFIMRAAIRVSTSVCLGILFIAFVSNAAPLAPINLWPGQPPGDKAELPPEKDTTGADGRAVGGKSVVRLGNVSKPTLTIYPATAEKATGAAVIICPGGGYNILAYDLEGEEVAQWLNSIGVTAGLLKYRVPKRPDRERYDAPLQDAQRALGLLRSRAGDLKLNAKRIGIMGFSAGGHLSAVACAAGSKRTYEKIDAADETSCRPDFLMLIYPAYLVKTDFPVLAPEVMVGPESPPAFLVHAGNDPIPVAGTVNYYLALQQAKVSAELHVYAEGGHGYGLRRTADTITGWPELAEKWLRGLKLLDR